MLLSEYLKLTRRMMNDQTFARLNEFDLRDYINIARNQVAVDGECVRTMGNATIGAGLVTVPIAELVTNIDAGQPLVVRNAWVNGSRVEIRPWDWFVAYHMVQPPAASPAMAHQGTGSLTYLYVSSRGGGQLMADVVALPLTLVDDTTFDHLPYPWTDAVPFYAGYYVYMSLERQEEANLYMQRYREVMRRAAAETTSSTLPENDPGGVGARIAASKIPLGLPPAPPVGQGR